MPSISSSARRASRSSRCSPRSSAIPSRCSATIRSLSSSASPAKRPTHWPPCVRPTPAVRGRSPLSTWSAAPFPRRRTTSSTPVPAPRSPLPRRRPIPRSWPSSICWPCISAKSSARLRRSAMPPCSRACSACRIRWRRSLCRRIWQRSRRLRRPSATTTTCFSSAAISTARPASREV